MDRQALRMRFTDILVNVSHTVGVPVERFCFSWLVVWGNLRSFRKSSDLILCWICFITDRLSPNLLGMFILLRLLKARIESFCSVHKGKGCVLNVL